MAMQAEGQQGEQSGEEEHFGPQLIARLEVDSQTIQFVCVMNFLHSTVLRGMAYQQVMSKS